MARNRPVSSAPTHPTGEGRRERFDIADLYQGPLDDGRTLETRPGLDEKFRQAYFWLVNHGIISPFYDIEFSSTPPAEYQLGDRKVKVTLPTDQSYSSYVLLPLLNLAARRRCLLVGGPGRGKTQIAILMGILGGYNRAEIQRAIQHGQPEMTVADLLGNPIPSSLMKAEDMDGIRIAWRKWLSMRVKIIDEYNRIPTRTQSSLLTVLADNYAEILDQVYVCPEAAWYLTANDDGGGGTYQVIEALRDRIDVVVKALHFNTRFLGELLTRVEEGIRPEDIVPREIIFSEAELEAANLSIRSVEIPRPLLRRMEYFASQFEFCEEAATQLEYMTKDTVKLAAEDLARVMEQGTGKDGVADLGRQTRNGLSVRALMTAMVFVKALAWFRGQKVAGFDDLRQILPFVLHDKLVINTDAPFFEQTDHAVYRIDRISWLRQLFDLSCREYDRLELDNQDPLAPVDEDFARGLEGLDEKTVLQRLAAIEKILSKWQDNRKFHGFMYDDVLKLKYYHQRYSNYLRWLEWQGVQGN